MKTFFRIQTLVLSVAIVVVFNVFLRSSDIISSKKNKSLVHSTRRKKACKQCPVFQMPASHEPSEIAQFYEDEIAGKNLMVRDYYDCVLKEREELLWEELHTTTGLTYENVVREKEKLKARHLKNIQKKKAWYQKTKKGEKVKKIKNISSQLVSLAYEVIDDFAVDPETIEIVSGSSTSVGCCELVLCERQLRGMPQKGARSVLAHEMIHLQQDDDFMRDAMCKLLSSKGIRYKKFNSSHPFYKHMRFEELRADILSSLKDISYAQGALESLSAIAAYGDRGHPTHPLTSERIREVQKIVDLLQYEQIKLQHA